MDMKVDNFYDVKGILIEVDSKDTEKLNFKEIVHKKCGEKHMDKDKFAEFNHRKHLCRYCDEYFYDNERGIGF